MLKKSLIISLLLLIPSTLLAKEIVGKVQSISTGAKVIQYVNPKTKEVAVIKYSDDTQLIDAAMFDDLSVNTKFKATLDENGVASKIIRVLVKVPAEQIIDTDSLFTMLEEGKKVFIADARPANVYNVGHIPTAHSTPANLLADNLNWLPNNKAQLIVFYCGGVTCPLSPAALKIAQKNGYKNVKAYIEGFPDWKAEIYPAHINSEWLTQNLDKHHVILDVRQNPIDSVKGAVAISATELMAMHEQMNKGKVPTAQRTIFNLRDKKAPIVIVADSAESDDAISAYEILNFWKFKNVVILSGGMQLWSDAKLPTSRTVSTLVYEKKLLKGAISEANFVAAVKTGAATIIDLRDPAEVMHGRVKGSINVPLADLDKNLSNFSKETAIILHCVGGSRASLAYTLLTNKGYTNVRYLNDSFADVAKDNGIELL